MAELTPDGLVTETLSDILETIEADQRANVSASLDQSTSSPLGQINRLSARAYRLLEEALAALYLAIDPDSASGDALLRLCAITGTIREAATPSRVEVTINVDAGTYAAGTLAVAPTGRPEDRFVNAEDVVAGSTGNYTVVFEAEETGPIQVAADTLEIAGPVAGWNSIVSHPIATPGSNIETEAALRARRNAEIESPGSSSVSGIAADITRTISDVVSCYVVENDTDATVDSIPAHSIEVVVFGPEVPTTDDDDAVAAQILESKAAGIGTYGTTSRTVYDDEGQAHVIRFTRPADVTINVAITLAKDATSYSGDDAVEEAIETAAEEQWVPGLDAAGSQIAAWVHGVAGVLRITAITLNGGSSFGAVSISSRQIARIGTITVTSSSASP